MTQFGILLPRAPSSAPERWFDHLVDMTTGAEETGFRSVWGDDPPVAAPGGLEAVTLLGGLGARTSTVRLGMLAALSCRPAGISRRMEVPIISPAVYPKIFSAPRFQLVMRWFKSLA